MKDYFKPINVWESIEDWFKVRLGILTRRQKIMGRMIYGVNPNEKEIAQITISLWRSE